MGKKSIIFVCLGNICRSPLAEGVAKAKAKELDLDIEIASAGLSRYHNGEPPCPISLELAKRNGVDISNLISQHISEFDLNSFDMVVAMDESNRRELEALGVKGVRKLGDFGFSGKSVADLYYEPEKALEVWNMVSLGVERALRELTKES